MRKLIPLRVAMSVANHNKTNEKNAHKSCTSTTNINKKKKKNRALETVECSHIAMDLGVHKEEVKRIMEAQLQLDKETTTTQLRRLLAQQDLANRLSKVADVPVASDGLSRFICIPCKNKLMSGEYFRTTAKAKATYEKNKDPTLTASGSNSQVQVTNKRTKDSSGPGASPQTRQCRPGAKRLTPEHPGRKLTYPDCDSSPADDRTTIPLSDICSIQVSTECSSTDDPGEQEIDVVDVSNVSQNPVEGNGQRMRTNIVAIATRP
eukprot:Em0005g692a